MSFVRGVAIGALALLMGMRVAWYQHQDETTTTFFASLPGSTPLYVACATLGMLAALMALVVLASEPAWQPCALGTGGYDLRVLEAPRSTGALLKLMSAALSSEWLGTLICRFLINRNQIELVRHLGSQVKDAAVHFPMMRLNAKAYAEHVSSASLPQPLRLVTSPGRSRRGVVDYHEMYREGRSTPTQEARRILAEAKSMNKSLRCFQEILEVSALEEAARSSERWAQGVPLGMFDGVPFAVKDEIRVKGTVLGDGLVIEGRQAAEEDDPVVARLRAAGGVLIGKTVMTTFGASPLGWNVDAQGPHNPYNGGHYTGGSSAGSAAAVSAGIVPVAIGLDGGGSIRIPAGFCGVFGLAPTFGRVPLQNLATSVLSVIKIGPIAADAASVAATYSIIAQPPPPEHPYFQMYGGDGPPPAHTAGFNEISSLAGLRLGIFKPHFEDASPAIVEACHKAVREMESLGATVVEVEIPHLFALSLAHGAIIGSEMASMHDEDWWQHSASIWPDTKVSLALFRTFTSKEYVSGLRLRAWALRWMREHVFAKVDAYVTPTTGITAPVLSASARPSGESDTVTVMQVMKFIFLGNFLGYPGITVPVGYEESTSLPISLHLMAEHWNEAVLLRAANSLQTTITQQLPSKFVSSK